MIKRFAKDIQKYFRYSIVSAKAQLKTEVANSYLNWIWWILEPFCFMLIYTFVFGYVFNSKEEHFSVYVFIGLSMWNFFNKVVLASIKMVKNNKPIVSKVYFPKYILLLTRMWVDGFKMLISFGIVIAMMIFYRIPVTLNVLYAIPVLACLFLLTFGIGCFFMHYGVYVQDLHNVVKIAMQMLFYITGIFYNVEKRIPQYGVLFNRYNPVAFLLSSMRKGLLYGQAPDILVLIVWLAVSVLLCVAGIRKVYKEENSYVKAI